MERLLDAELFFRDQLLTAETLDDSDADPNATTGAPNAWRPSTRSRRTPLHADNAISMAAPPAAVDPKALFPTVPAADLEPRVRLTFANVLLPGTVDLERLVKAVAYAILSHRSNSATVIVKLPQATVTVLSHRAAAPAPVVGEEGPRVSADEGAARGAACAASASPSTQRPDGGRAMLHISSWGPADSARTAAIAVCRLIRDVMQWPSAAFNSAPFRTTNICVHFQVGPINLMKLAEAHPEGTRMKFRGGRGGLQGCELRMNGMIPSGSGVGDAAVAGKWSVTAEVAAQGSVRMMGLQSVEQASCAYHAILAILVKFKAHV